MMRRVVVTVFLVAIMGLAAAGPAKADGTEILNFTFTFDGNTYAWSLPAIPPNGSFVPTSGFSIEFGPPFSYTLAIGNQPPMNQPSANVTLDFFCSPIGNLSCSSSSGADGGFDLSTCEAVFPCTDILDTSGAQIYGGTEMSPTFSPTSGSGITLDTSVPGSGSGTLVITSASAVPEPGSLAMIGTGLLALLGIARKKLSS